MINLDDTSTILNAQGGEIVLRSVDALPQQLEQSFSEALQVPFPSEYRTIKNILVCGMGGSRFPAVIVKELCKQQISVPFLINDDYNLPGFVNKNTLVILSSYSGTTEEVVTMGKSALKRGVKITGITIGGDIAYFLQSIKAPGYIFKPTHNPSNQPRLAFGYAVGAQLGLLVSLGILTESKDVIEKAVKNSASLFNSMQIDTPTKENPAKKLAQQLFNKYPYYIVSEFLCGVGNAVANQTNETAKVLSTFRVIPELNHHLMEGLKFPEEIQKIITFVFFYSKLYSPAIQKRFHITKDVVEQNKIQTIWHELKGENPIEQAFELMGLGAYLTMYLATLYGQDPSIVPYVDYFKKKLKE